MDEARAADYVSAHQAKGAAENASAVDTAADAEEKPVVYKYSFIANRVGEKTKKKGPRALFSRYNVSISMTRSLGDRYAARSCISVPEITALTLAAGEHARWVGE